MYAFSLFFAPRTSKCLAIETDQHALKRLLCAQSSQSSKIAEFRKADTIRLGLSLITLLREPDGNRPFDAKGIPTRLRD